MAEVFLSAFLPTVFDKLASQALLQYGKLWGVEKQLQKLESKLSAIRAVLQDAEEKQAKDMALRDWLAKLKDAAYDAEDVLDEFHTEAMRREAVNRKGQKVRTFVSKRIFSLFRIRIARKIEDIVERLKDITEEKKFHLKNSDGDAAFNRQIGTAIRPPTHSFITASSFVGREEDKRKISELLVSQDGRKELSVLPIVGIGGLGKTTLAQMVYNDKTVAEYFELKMWVCVSEDFDVQKLSKAIIESATNTKCELPSMDSLQRRLRELLSNKRFLLVLDDVWNEDEQKWHDLKMLITVGSEGSAVLVTTRSHKVSSIMRTGYDGYDHQLGNLSEEACWTLFKGRAFEGSADIEKHPNLVPLGKAIVSKCGGSPLAANSLGGLMRFKRGEWEWKAVIESKMWELQEDQVMASLKLSYNNLHPQLKQCFAFCAIFPKDYEIERDMLIQLWMAHGFIPFDGRTELELKGREIFNELELTSFFQEISEGKITTCKMHDLVHDLACSILGNECLNIVSREESIDADRRKVRHLFVNCSMEDGGINGLNISRCTRTLLFSKRYYHKGNSLTDWSKAMYLRCLDLHANDRYRSGLSKVPNSVCNLKLLRYLDLSNNSFESLPEAICSLFNLQTLKLSWCHKLCELPKGMRKMTSLRHLYLDGCSDLKCMPTGMGQLKCLQTLTRYILAKDNGSGSIGELGSLKNIGGLLQLCNLEHVRRVTEAEEAKLGGKQNLQSLELNWRRSELNWRWSGSESESGDGLAAANIDEQVLEALRPHHNLKRLTISSYRGTRFPMWLMEVSIIFKYLVEISLNGCNRCECLPQLGTLPLLEVLLIEGMDSVKRIGGSQFYGSDGAVVFPSLRKFFMHGMDELEQWSEVEEDRPSFPHLVDLTIIWCPRLATIPGHLSPQCLDIRYCPLLLPPPQWSMGNMKRQEELTLRYSDNMALMWGQDDDDDDHEGTTSLVKLEIASNSDQTMFSSRYLGRLNKLCSLESLEFSDCAGLVSLPIETIQTLSSLKILRISGCSNLRGHHPLQCLVSLARLNIDGCDELESLQFPESIRQVTIRGCPQIRSFPEGMGCLSRLESLWLDKLVNLASLPEGMECLKALKLLWIDGCPRLTSLPVGLQQCLPNLTQLSISGSPDLVKRCKRDGGEYWPLISNIPGLSIGEYEEAIAGLRWKVAMGIP